MRVNQENTKNGNQTNTEEKQRMIYKKDKHMKVVEKNNQFIFSTERHEYPNRKVKRSLLSVPE